MTHWCVDEATPGDYCLHAQASCCAGALQQEEPVQFKQPHGRVVTLTRSSFSSPQQSGDGAAFGKQREFFLPGTDVRKLRGSLLRTRRAVGYPRTASPFVFAGTAVGLSQETDRELLLCTSAHWLSAQTMELH